MHLNPCAGGGLEKIAWQGVEILYSLPMCYDYNCYQWVSNTWDVPLKRVDPTVPSNINGSDMTDQKQSVVSSPFKYMWQSHLYQMISTRLMLFKSAPRN